MSGTMIVSFSPLATPSSEHYGTPKSILSEQNDSSFASFDETITNSPQKRNSSMYLIDLTTPAPIKIQSSNVMNSNTSPTSRRSNSSTLNTPTSTMKQNLLRSALKNSSTNLTQRKLKESTNSLKENDTGKTTDEISSGNDMMQNVQTKTPAKKSLSNFYGQNEIIHEDERNDEDTLKKNACFENYFSTKALSTETKDLPINQNDEHNWIETVLQSNKDNHEQIRPNSKSQILSERYSNITPEMSCISNVSTDQLSLLSSNSKALSFSPISTITVAHNGTTETSEILSSFNDSEKLSPNIGNSLRSTRKQINRALISLNESKSTELLFESQDDSVVNTADEYLPGDSQVQKDLIYANLDGSKKADVQVIIYIH